MVSTSEFTEYDEALAYLMGRINYERASKMPYRSRGLKLDRMRELARRIGDPHLDYPIIHVAGTKGKGSTANMIAAILSAAGLRTGLYTSPHFESMEERLRIDRRCCSQREFVDALLPVRAAVQAMESDPEPDGESQNAPTYFDILTAMAMLHFSRHSVDAAVLEVGLGGRLDSTNICQPTVTVITSISYDHTRELGKTLESIAREKAGIVKPGIPLVCGATDARPRKVICRIAAERSAPLVLLGRDFKTHYVGPANGDTAGYGGRFLYQKTGARETPYHIGLVGRHQAENAGLALAAVECFAKSRGSIAENAKAEGLSSARCVGRAEVIPGTPPVLLDVAHNVASIAALLDVVDEHFADCRRRTLVFAATRGKDAAGMLRLLLPKFHRILLTRYLKNPRTVEPGELADSIRNLNLTDQHSVEVFQDPADAWLAACDRARPAELICVTGSFFLAAELRRTILGSRGVAD